MTAELVLAIVPIVDMCVGYGRTLAKLIAALRDTEVEISERLLRLDQSSLRLDIQLKFVEQVRYRMDEEHLRSYKDILRQLGTKIQTVISILETILKNHESKPSPSIDNSPSWWRHVLKKDTSDAGPGNGLDRLKYALKKGKLDRAIEEVEKWLQMSDLSWFLILKSKDCQDDALWSGRGGSDISTAIPSVISIRESMRGDSGDDGGRGRGNSSGGENSGAGSRSSSSSNRTQLSLSEAELNKMKFSNIPFCDALVGDRELAANTTTTYIINRIVAPPSGDYRIATKDVRDMAARMRHSEPHTFGLLTCKGFVPMAPRNDDSFGSGMAEMKFTMIFRMPPGLSDPQSLRYGLITAGRTGADSDLGFSISDRLEIAYMLAKSVSYVHTFGFVHKNIRPETILTFASDSSSCQRRSSTFLSGFESFRRAEGLTLRRGDDAWQWNLYRHPSRQGGFPDDKYVMQHDIYSLGVCMLEVGLWQSFVRYRGGAHPTPSNLLGLPEEGRGDQISRYLRTEMKDRLVLLARGTLRASMGNKFSDVVVTCLTCLDPDSAEFGDGDEFENKDGIRVGVRYIEKVMLSLSSISV